MGLAGVGSALGSLVTQYDFTKMTNQQLLNAVDKLGSEGKLSQIDAGQLSFIAQGVDDAYPDGGGPTSVSQFLSDPTQHNFISELQNIDNSVHSVGGSVGAALYDSMLKDLETYQMNSTSANDSRLSVDA